MSEDGSQRAADNAEAEAKAARLRAFFAPDAVAWEPAGSTKALKPGDTFVCVPFVTAAEIVQRLDDVLGVGNWSESYRVADGAVTCTLRARLCVPLGWVDRVGVSPLTNGADPIRKHAEALRMAAARLGVGRYLSSYYQSATWASAGGWDRKPVLPDAALPERFRKAGRELAGKLRGLMTQCVEESGRGGRKLDGLQVASLFASEYGQKPDDRGQVNFSLLPQWAVMELMERCNAWLADVAGNRLYSSNCPVAPDPNRNRQEAKKETKNSAPKNGAQTATGQGHSGD